MRNTCALDVVARLGSYLFFFFSRRPGVLDTSDNLELLLLFFTDRRIFRRPVGNTCGLPASRSRRNE